MSKISVEFDTVTKEGSIKMDGKDFPDASFFGMNPSYEQDGKWQIEISSRKYDEENKIYQYTSTRASLNGEMETRPATPEEIARIAPPKESPESGLAKAIAAYRKAQ